MYRQILEKQLPLQISKKRRGFTLMELLVVIAIIAVLATIGYPAFMAIMKRSKRVAATNMIESMETGVDRYFNEYNYLPNFRTSNPPSWDYWLFTNEGQNIHFLRDLTGESDKFNIKGKNFLRLKNAKGRKGGFFRADGGKGKVQYLYDEVGGGFGYIVDYDYDEELPIPSFYRTSSSGNTIKGRHIIIWNFGPDKERGTSDDITSW
ncbi:MAG: prepilin-type N-terminal cleavage/methylation domain-containing protein [Verrucomicrobiae bacterium]|nr:prepilin-type N-terminal cleavage/methylation domain-containing protein [Verrucomicrobiae bacterium]NNJ86437.1 prepilin-type N-terminal cleavage/methylation domain-containing protein [Akkermansiaceae bacterium]